MANINNILNKIENYKAQAAESTKAEKARNEK